MYIVLVRMMVNGWKALSESKEMSDSFPLVSIVIAARNEAHQIGATIDGLLAQNYPKDRVEILIIDDHSTDQTAEVVRSYTDDRIQLIQWNTTQKLNSYKKKAIADAISKSNGEWIVTTDADCQMGPEWLSNLMAFSSLSEVKMVSAPVVFHKEKSLFERLQTLEFLYLIGLGAAGIGLGRASTCNGANLAYRKSTFHEVGGFQGIDQLASGDDELLLHKIAEKYPGSIRFCKQAGAFVFTDAKPDLKSFIQQRKRWASKSTKYRNKGIIALGVSIWLFNALLLGATIGILYDCSYWLVVAGVWMSKVLVEYRFLVPITTFAKRNELLKLLPLVSPLHVMYLVYIGIAGNIGTYEWKGRSVR